MSNNIVQIGIAFVLVVLLVLVTDPFMYWMPPMAAMAALVAVTTLLLVWAGFVMFERASDERETIHRMNAGRIAYLSGIAVLTAGLFMQGMFSHVVDPWIAGSLGAMVAAKLAARLYYERNG